MTLPPGKQIARYQLIELIGTGGIASVYQAFDPLFNRIVAIKLMHPSFSLQEEFRKRFLREAQATARLRHPGIVEILDFGETPEHQLYIVMEFVQGPNLEQLLSQSRQEQRQIAVPEAVRLMRQLAEATAFANENGVLHRDLKPANILLKQRPPASPGELLRYNPLITDFGLARLEGGADVTQPGVSIGGTPAYMAPEQLGNEPLDERCDVYSLGVIFYELVTGQLPYQLKTLQDAVRQHALHTLPLRTPQQLRPDLPDGLSRLISQAIDPVRDQRLPSSRALAQALSAMADNLQPSRAVLDNTVPDLTVPDLIVPDSRASGAKAPDPEMSDMTLPALSIPNYQVPSQSTPRAGQAPKSSEKTEKTRTAAKETNRTIAVDPALTLVSPQPVKRNVAAIVLTTLMIVIAAALVWYFVTKLQGANTGPGSLATADTGQIQDAGAPTATVIDGVTTTAAASADATLPGAVITQTLAEPLAPLTETLSSQTPEAAEASEQEEIIDPSLEMTATVIGPDTSHPTQLWIDGDPTDWQVLRALSKSQTTKLDSLYDNQASAGCQARYPGSSAAVDLAAEVQIAYDTTNLYVSFLVHDDGYVANTEPSKYEQGDATQLLLKLSSASESTAAPSREDEYQIDFLPGIDHAGDRPAATIRSLARPTDIHPYSEGSVAASLMDGGYFLEAALPWSTFGAVPPQAGQELGVVANVSDNDTPATQLQECLLSSLTNYSRDLPVRWAALVLE